jgi:hypothetical protein
MMMIKDFTEINCICDLQVSAPVSYLEDPQLESRSGDKLL